jgi:hypothetical protein
MAARERPYIAYLLRLWWTKQNGCGIWRASLEDPRSGERYCFASLELLIEFLRSHTSKLGDKETHPPI